MEEIFVKAEPSGDKRIKIVGLGYKPPLPREEDICHIYPIEPELSPEVARTHAALTKELIESAAKRVEAIPKTDLSTIGIHEGDTVRVRIEDNISSAVVAPDMYIELKKDIIPADVGETLGTYITKLRDKPKSPFREIKQYLSEF